MPPYTVGDALDAAGFRAPAVAAVTAAMGLTLAGCGDFQISPALPIEAEMTSESAASSLMLPFLIIVLACVTVSEAMLPDIVQAASRSFSTVGQYATQVGGYILAGVMSFGAVVYAISSRASSSGQSDAQGSGYASLPASAGPSTTPTVGRNGEMLCPYAGLPQHTRDGFANALPRLQLESMLPGARRQAARQLIRDNALVGWSPLPGSRVIAHFAGTCVQCPKGSPLQLCVDYCRPLDAVCDCNDYQLGHHFCKHAGCALLEAQSSVMLEATEPVFAQGAESTDGPAQRTPPPRFDWSRGDWPMPALYPDRDPEAMVLYLRGQLEKALRDLSASQAVNRALYARTEHANSQLTAMEFDCDELRHLLRVKGGYVPDNDPLMRADAASRATDGDVFIVRSEDMEMAWERMVLHASREIVAVTPIFESEVMADALCAARRRDWWSTGGVRCRLLLNGELMDRSNTESRVERILRMRDCGVRIRFNRDGFLHQRSLLADRRMYVGSSGFMQAVSATVTLGVVISLSEASASKELERFDDLWSTAASNWDTSTHGLLVTDLTDWTNDRDNNS